MSATRSIARPEADLAALRAAAERAGTSLACLFSTADEFEAEVVRVRREQGAFRAPNRSRTLWRALALVAIVTLVFVLI